MIFNQTVQKWVPLYHIMERTCDGVVFFKQGREMETNGCCGHVVVGGRMDNRIECRAKRDFWEKVLHFRKKVFCLEAYIYFWLLSTALGNTINFF
jgi:hypothetical protein